MSRNTLVNEVGEWLIDQMLSQPDIVEMFGELCVRLKALGIPLSRARLTWPTLHPLFQAETILWTETSDIHFEQFRHQDDVSEEWKRSPLHFILENHLETLRRNLDGPNKQLDFPILEDLVAEGHTDYLLIATAFSGTRVRNTRMESGILVAWSSNRLGGFSDDDLAALKKIQRRFAAACKNVVQQRIARNITETYLGRHAGRQVLDGAIKLGDGRQTQAVVYYADMRNSTSLADTMASEDFLALLNDYFACSAGPAIEFGGEVLDFIGDAVLAIFPFEDEAGKAQAIGCATLAMEEAIRSADEKNAERVSQGKIPFDFGIGLTLGSLMFGNIGVASRLSFSVIGPTVNEAERIETLTKSMEAKALATAEIAKAAPGYWSSVGEFSLMGVAQKVELFALRSVPDGKSTLFEKSRFLEARATFK
ncbi:MAG: adenylate/guanylate cyclase domain-containing protein [Pseudomonadota bacterium]